VLFTAAEYKSMREEYCYYDRDCRFEIAATAFLDSQFVGKYEGIFPKTVPPHYTHGINLRRFEQMKINDNVLIEIGAAMALYGKKVILLVEGGVTLPSNLQGLYRCEFAGDRLEYESTMKLLKTFSQFR
jgi:hypothetical protein